MRTFALVLMLIASSACAQTQRISFESTPVAGQSTTITYTFEGSGMSEVTLRVTFYPSESSEMIVLNPDSPSGSLQVPSDSTSILVEDIYGPSSDKSSAVEPSPDDAGSVQLRPLRAR